MIIILKKAKKEIADIHTSLQQFVKKIEPGLSAFAGKNELKINEQIELLERMLKRNVEKKV
ncbi:hypothetical protein ACT7DJ_10165 [Bacillus cereus]